MELLIETSESFRVFVSNLVIRTKQQIILKQGNYLGHPEFVPAQKRIAEPHLLTLIDTGKMLSTFTCNVEQVDNGIKIIVTSPVDYATNVQDRSGKNWDILDFTAEELAYYAKEIYNNTQMKRTK